MTYEVRYNNILIGSTQLDGRGMFEDKIGLKINNELFRKKDCQSKIKLFLNTFHLKINNFSCIDLFIDTRDNIRDIFIEMFNNKQDYLFNTRVKTIDFFGSIDVEGYIIPGNFKPTFYLGSNHTGKRVTIYNKTKELQAKGHKQSITVLHDEHLTHDKENDVYRFELRLKNSYLQSKKYSIDLDSLFDEEFIKYLISSNLTNFFDFRERTSTRPNRCKAIHFFDLSVKSVFQARNGLAASNNDSHKTTSTLNQQQIEKSKKSIIRKMIKTAIIEYDKQSILNVKHIAIQYNLLDFYEKEIKDLGFLKEKDLKKEIKKSNSIF
ncbi:replication initiation factor domain-containing protein [Rufibacter sp. XAAS-G3-1]|uniref:replication initiation factor domain-containing protein n=1 Tax=Rufibacter sp. XAAS-G3-1 TaxID=2729134 RepID=UPI0015E76A48|nr:replication initiation factor domain-containing protein [Rufibacter sp. XAAS-G3-1]